MTSRWQRWLWHLSACLSLAAAAWFAPKTIFLISLGAVTFLFLLFEFTRFKITSINRWFFSCFGSLLRPEEVSSVTTSSYVLVAALIAYLAFGKDIAVLSVCFLAVGDVAAAIMGSHCGKIRLFGKVLEGDLSCFIACLVTGFILFYAGLNISAITILVGAIAATIGQAIKTPMDDNLIMPLFAGMAMAAAPG